jgi:tetratricopeptide (TPR) repeat protein
MRRHADHYLGEGLRAAVRAEGRAGDEARRFLRDELDNLLAIHRRALPNDPERALRAAIVVQPLLITAGPTALRLQLIEAGLDAVEDATNLTGPLAQLRGWAWLARADCMLGLGRLEDASADLTLAVQTAREQDDDYLAARAVWRRGTLAFIGGRLDESEGHVREALASFKRVGDRIHVGRCLGSLGLIHQSRGELDEARRLHEEALEHHVAEGDRRWVGTTTLRLGQLEDARGALNDAARYYELALATLREGHHRRHEAQTLVAMGALATERSEVERARDRLAEALGLLSRVPDPRTETLCLIELGHTLAVMGDGPGARAHLQRARTRAMGLGNRTLQARASAALAVVLVDESDSNIEAAEALLENDPRGEEVTAIWAIAQGRLAALRGDRLAAAAALEATAETALHSAEVRRARVDLERALDDEPPADQLVVEAKGEWIKPPKAPRAELSHRDTLRRVLGALMRARFEDGGVALDAEALFAAGWPGERAKPTAATSRVYVALSTLRKLGLGDALIKDDEGYRLDPEVPILRWS